VLYFVNCFGTFSNEKNYHIQRTYCGIRLSIVLLGEYTHMQWSESAKCKQTSLKDNSGYTRLKKLS